MRATTRRSRGVPRPLFGLGIAGARSAAGNSVKGQLAATFLSRRLGVGPFASLPARRWVVAGSPAR